MADDQDAKYYRKPWMTDDQWACAQFVADASGGFHHVAGECKEFGAGVAVSVFTSSMATFDFDRLTRLVLLAHDRCIRLELGSSGPGRIKLVLHQRHARIGPMSGRHPTIEEAIEVHRRTFAEPRA